MVPTPEQLRLSAASSVPAFWPAGTPAWLRQRGRTVVIVIDDQYQNVAQMADERALRRRLIEPLNVEFVFCPECKAGSESSRDGRWFPAAEALVGRHRESAAAIFLDLLFYPERNPETSSGVKFLNRLKELRINVPVLIMTSEPESSSLATALASHGRHHAFLCKNEGDKIEGMLRFLVDQGWVAHPQLGAFSRIMREQASLLRQYAFAHQPLDSGLPAPMAITGASGSGKSHLAHQIAEWLLEVKPALRSKHVEERFVASEEDRGQSAQTVLFGRGPQDPSEKAQFAGLVVVGKAQKAHQGILIIEELGNSSPDLQRMLLEFVDTGKTRPLFPAPAMDSLALGPLDVLCLFTAQPAHIEQGLIITDLVRRVFRGETILIPSMRDRVEDALPIFYNKLKAYRKANDKNWLEPDNLGEIIVPGAQVWIEGFARRGGISASVLTDLVGTPRVRVIGISYLEDRMGRRRPGELRTSVAASPAPSAKQEKPPLPKNGLEWANLLADASLRFARDRESLHEQLPKVEAAASNLLLSYLEACLELAQGASTNINITGTYRFQTGDESVQTNQVKGEFGKLFELETVPHMVLKKLRQSDRLAALALVIAGSSRRKGLARLIEALAKEPGGRERLLRLLTLLRPGEERRKAEELLTAGLAGQDGLGEKGVEE